MTGIGHEEVSALSSGREGIKNMSTTDNKFVLKDKETGKYVAKPTAGKSCYTASLKQALIYKSKKAADDDKAVTEVVLTYSEASSSKKDK